MGELEALQKRVLELEGEVIREREAREKESACLEAQLSSVWEAAEAEARVKEVLKAQVRPGV